jgi:hypothetical protein
MIYTSIINDSATHVLEKVNDIMIEFNITFVHVDFVIMVMGSKASSTIILRIPFLRTTGAIIDLKEGIVNFQFTYKKEVSPIYKLPHNLHTT